MSIKNKIIGAFCVLIVLSLISSFVVSYNIKEIKQNVDYLSNKDFAGVTFLLEADRDSYQSNLALLKMMNTYDKAQIEKLIKKGILNNLSQVKQRFEKFKNLLYNDMIEEKTKFNEFDSYFERTSNNTKKIIKMVNEEKYEEAKNFYFSTYLNSYDSMRSTMDYFTEATYKVVKSNQEDTSNIINNSITLFILISIIIIIVTIAFSIALGRTINNSINSFQNGLLNFFSYLNRQSDDVLQLDESSKDEIAKMAKVVNENINKTKSLIEQDNKVINEVKQKVQQVKQGNIRQVITNSTQNKSLEDLKVIFNEMLEVIANNVCDDLNKIQEALKNYSELNFTYKLDSSKGKTAEGLNQLAKTITKILVNNKENGLTLQKSANHLLENVDVLNSASNEAAASLEQTAAALEEITSTIVSNNKSIEQMTQYANQVTNAAKNGEELASQTTKAMDNLNEQVSSINEAITVIDQIAFQTNILSLNAAVEAATAGEAGKGFAVVAGEVRNLASRSAQAAKEIKELVENATSKSEDGKLIANNMIKGYSQLNENIKHTLELIDNVSQSSKEQKNGIEQISAAVNQLDQQTQQNASVSNATKDIANQTKTIADSIVDEANEKEFDGKNQIKAKNIKQEETKTITTTTNKSEKNDEWESF